MPPWPGKGRPAQYSKELKTLTLNISLIHPKLKLPNAFGSREPLMPPPRQAFGASEQVCRIAVRIDIVVLRNFACLEIAASCAVVAPYIAAASYFVAALCFVACRLCVSGAVSGAVLSVVLGAVSSSVLCAVSALS